MTLKEVKRVAPYEVTEDYLREQLPNWEWKLDSDITYNGYPVFYGTKIKGKKKIEVNTICSNSETGLDWVVITDSDNLILGTLDEFIEDTENDFYS